MKTRILFLASLAILTLGVQAQTRVTPSTTRTFTVNQTNAVALSATPYSWSANNTTGTAVTNVAAVSATTTNSVDVTFGANIGDAATLSVFAISLENCSGDSKSINVVVDNLVYTAVFAQLAQDLCPQTTSNPAGGNAAAVTVNFAGGPVNSFVVNIDGVSQNVTVAPAAASYSLDLATAFTNAQFGAHTVEITSITGALGSDLQVSGSTVHTINVSEAPIINDIF